MSSTAQDLDTAATWPLGTDFDLRRYGDVRDLVGSLRNPTPLVRINHVLATPRTETWLKLEWLNPFGSIKDRTALYLLRGMAERGELDGREIVEPSSGNTGIALAALGALAGTRVTVTMPDGVPEEKKVLLRMLGTEVWSTPDDLRPVRHPKDGAIALAHSLANGPAASGSPCRTSTKTPTTCEPTTRPPAPRSGARPRAACASSSQGTAPAARSPGRGATQTARSHDPGGGHRAPAGPSPARPQEPSGGASPGHPRPRRDRPRDPGA